MSLEKIIKIKPEIIKRFKQDVNDIDVIMSGKGIIYNPCSMSMKIYSKFGYDAVTNFQDTIFKGLCKDYNLTESELGNMIMEYKLED